MSGSMNSKLLPDAEKNHKPDPGYLRNLIKQSGLTQREIARLLGIQERLLRAYLADPLLTSSREAPYPIQFCLECLANNA